jgi:hypothetical protein
MRCATTLLALLLAGASLSACGDSDDDARPSGASTTGTSTTRTAQSRPPVTRESYIAEADALCKESNAEAKRLNEELQRAAASAKGDAQILARLEPILRRGYAAQQRRRDEFVAITPPAADRSITAKIKTSVDEQTALVGRLVDAADRRDVQRFTGLNAEQERVSSRTQALMEGYGFTECGSGRNEAEPPRSEDRKAPDGAGGPLSSS